MTGDIDIRMHGQPARRLLDPATWPKVGNEVSTVDITAARPSDCIACGAPALTDGASAWVRVTVSADGAGVSQAWHPECNTAAVRIIDGPLWRRRVRRALQICKTTIHLR